MAKKKETKKQEVTEEVTQVVKQPTVMEKPLPKPKDTWEIKDRTYFLKSRGFGLDPLFLLILLYIILWQRKQKKLRWKNLKFKK